VNGGLNSKFAQFHHMEINAFHFALENDGDKEVGEEN
jgi:hypothetical protein